MVQAKRSIFTVAMASLLSAPAYSAAVSMEESTTIEASASLDVVSAYIFRGVTLNKNAAFSQASKPLLVISPSVLGKSCHGCRRR